MDDDICCGIKLEYNFCAKCGKPHPKKQFDRMRDKGNCAFNPMKDEDNVGNVYIPHIPAKLVLMNKYLGVPSEIEANVYNIRHQGLVDLIRKIIKCSFEFMQLIPRIECGWHEVKFDEVYACGVADRELDETRAYGRPFYGMRLLAMSREELDAEFPFLAGKSMEQFLVKECRANSFGERVYDLALIFAVYDAQIVEHYMR